MSRAEQSPSELAFTELFRRLPVEPPPIGFRDSVMAQIVRQARSPWEWIVAAALAFPSLLFLLWQLLERGGELTDAFAALMNAVSSVDDSDAGRVVFVDGSLLLAVALLGLAGLLVTHALLAGARSRPRSLPA